MSGMTRARRIVLGLALAVTLSAVAVPPALAAPAEPSPRAAGFWETAIEWLASWIGGPLAGGGSSGAAACKLDQGACVDPNG